MPASAVAPPAAPVAKSPAATALARPASAPGIPPMPVAALPPDLRAELPPLVIGGSVYSGQPALRFIIVNGQLVHEGEAAAPGVTVEHIGPKAAVLRWRDRRLEVPL